MGFSLNKPQEVTDSYAIFYRKSIVIFPIIGYNVHVILTFPKLDLIIKFRIGDKMKKVLGLVLCSLFLFTGCGHTSYFQSTELVEDSEQLLNEESTDALSSVVTQRIFVQVAGAVSNPGVYQLSTGSRVYAAIEAAGGLLETADDSDINQASLLEDGQKIYVYTIEERQKIDAINEAEEDGLININTATAVELTTLPGVGQAKANQIVSYRNANGTFKSIEEIKNVSGIGDGIFNQINSLIKI